MYLFNLFIYSFTQKTCMGKLPCAEPWAFGTPTHLELTAGHWEEEDVHRWAQLGWGRRHIRAEKGHRTHVTRTGRANVTWRTGARGRGSSRTRGVGLGEERGQYGWNTKVKGKCWRQSQWGGGGDGVVGSHP